MSLGDDLALAWKHLAASDPTQEGWRTISITSDRGAHLLAGRRFPGNEEALLVGFTGLSIARMDIPGESEGFAVESVTLNGSDVSWLAVTRKAGSNLDLFQKMIRELADITLAHADSSSEKSFRALVGRIRAWQEFMRKSRTALCAEEERGFVGELSMLVRLIELGLPAVAVLRAWEGPLDGIHDFVFGSGAIEVKSSLSSVGFPARIASLDQLDDAHHQPLFVAAVRLRVDVEGLTLPQHIGLLRKCLGGDSESLRLFHDRLLSAGYNEAQSHYYDQRLSVSDVRLIEVAEGFPRLIPGNVPVGVRKVNYDIELDQIQAPRLALADAVKRLGVL